MGKIKTTANLALEAGTTLDISSTNAALNIAAGTGTISLGNNAAASSISIGSVAADKTIDIGFGLANMGIRIGVANGTSSVAIESGTGGVSVNSVGGSVSLTGSTGAIVDAAAGAIGVGSQISDNPVNIGTLATAGRTITLGNTTGTTAVNINIGTGDFTMTSATGTLMSQLDTGEMTRPLQPAFLGVLGGNDNNVTGAGATYNLGTNVALTEIFDQGGDFTTAGVFTAPVTGRYMFSVTIAVGGVTAAMTRGYISVVTSNRTYFFNIINPGASQGLVTPPPFSFSGTCLADLDSADTALVAITIENGVGNDADIDGTTSTNVTVFFSGHLVC